MPLQAITAEAGQSREFGWQMWLLCSSISVGFFSLLMLLAYQYFCVGDDNDTASGGGEYSSLGNPKRSKLGFQFPGKEDKSARYKRWARCLRKEPPPARPPIQVCHVEVNLQIALEAFAEGVPKAAEHELASPSHAEVQPPSDTTRTPDLGYQEGCYLNPLASDTWPGTPAAPPPPALSSSDALKALEAGGKGEEVRERIFKFLIDAGPPKQLCAISEAADESKSPSSSRPHTRASLPRARPMPTSSSQSVLVPLPLLLDGEEVLRVGTQSTPLTRELLWAALAQISRGNFGGHSQSSSWH